VFACRLYAQAPAAAADAEDAEGAANAAADAAVRAGQLPKEDDGVSCLLLRLPKGWGPPRLQAFVERFGAKPASVSKNAGAHTQPELISSMEVHDMARAKA
jgi:hypothetical protein